MVLIYYFFKTDYISIVTIVIYLLIDLLLFPFVYIYDLADATIFNNKDRHGCLTKYICK